MNEKYNFKCKFADGLCWQKLFLIFIIGCVFGAVYEDVLIYIMLYIKTGTPQWILHRGVIYGPFSPIYGFGAVLMTYFLVKNNRKDWQTFIYASLLGGFVEYALSFLQETFIGTTSWDYSDKLLNINGRTTVIYMVFWGVLGICFVKVIYPFISNIIEKIPVNLGNIFTKCLLIFMIFNCLISWTALYRQTERRKGIAPHTKIGQLYDIYYTDDFLHKYFENMVPSTGKEN